MHNYGEIKSRLAAWHLGQATLLGNGSIINYHHILDIDTSFPAYADIIRTPYSYHILKGMGTTTGNYKTETGVSITSAIADLCPKLKRMNETDVAVLASNSCAETDKVMLLTNTESTPIEITANIANDTNGIFMIAHGLKITGLFKFRGDQSYFNADHTEVKLDNANVELSGVGSLPHVPITVTNGSTLKLTHQGNVN
jgi:hypothetical protein